MENGPRRSHSATSVVKRTPRNGGELSESAVPYGCCTTAVAVGRRVEVIFRNDAKTTTLTSSSCALGAGVLVLERKKDRRIETVWGGDY